MINKTITQLAEGLKSRDFSSEELTRAYLDRISALDGDICAFITVTAEKALSDARRIDEMRLKGNPLPVLAGIPFAVKDNLCVSGIRTTCGSRMLENFIAPYTATAVSRLTSEGAVLLGKLNMDEFAMGSATDTSAFGITKNPLDTTRVAGGSSGGSAAAVAVKMAAFTLGTDTGGSVRQPAAFCGVVGLKPTYSAVSRYGLIAFASSLDQIGPITARVSDNAIVFKAICGHDKMDATSCKHLFFNSPQSADVAGLRIGFWGHTEDKVSDDVSAAILRARDILVSMGTHASCVELPDTDASLAAYYIISASEASSNLGRYDGVRYGYRPDGMRDVDDLFIRSRTEGFGDEVKRRIMLGVFCLNRDGRDAYYKKALAAKARICAELDTLFENCDAIIAPIAPTVAYRLSEKKPRPVDVYRDDAYGVLANIAGIPSLCVPCGYSEDGMPVGIQIMGKKFSEHTLYKIGLALESALGGKS